MRPCGLARLRLLGSAIVLLLLSLATPCDAARMGFGINGHPLAAYTISYEQQLDLIADLGLKYYRVDISADSAADGLDRLIELATARGIKILPVITPQLALDTEEPAAIYDKAFKLAAVLGARLKGRIPVWELGNEQENYAIIRPCEMRVDGTQYSCNWGPAGGVTTGDYYGPRWSKVSALLKGLSDGLASADPAALKAMGTAGWGHVGAFQRMADDGIKWDISVWHMYGEDPEWAFKTLYRFGHPIWVTEFNHPFGSEKGEAAQAEGLALGLRRLADLAPAYRVEQVFIYELMDETYWAPSFEAVMGLVHLDGSAERGWHAGAPKAAYKTVKALAAQLGQPVRIADASRPSVLSDAPPAYKRNCDLDALRNFRDTTLRHRLSYAYCLILGRMPDGLGQRNWSQEIGKGRSLTDMLLGMMSSTEFQTTNPVVAEHGPAAVEVLYRLLLGREPGGDATIAADRIKRGTLRFEELQKLIILSAEFKSKHPVLYPAETIAAATPFRVTTDTAGIKPRSCDLAALGNRTASDTARIAYGYCLVLGRDADGAGLADYTAAIHAGTPVRDVLVGLSLSDEASARFAAVRGNREFVATLYRELLDREPDGGGLQSYASNLDRGTITRADLWRSIIASEEFARKHRLLF